MQKTSAEVISAEEQNFNKQMAEFTISIPFQYFFKILKIDFTIQYFFNTVWEPCWWLDYILMKFAW